MSISSDSKTHTYRMLYASVDTPTDYGYIVYIICFYLGVGNLFPWNALITASNYYAERFCGTSFEDSFENYFSIAFNVCQTIGLALSVKYGNQIPLSKKIIYPFFFYSIIFLVSTIMVVIVDINPNILFGITLLSAGLSGSCGSILSGGLFGLGAMLPSIYTAALMNGQALAGLTVSVASILTLLAETPDDECSDDDLKNDDSECTQSISYSALSYFIIATLVLLSSIFAFIILIRSDFTKYYLAKAEVENTKVIDEFVDPFLTNITNVVESPDEVSIYLNNDNNLQQPSTSQQQKQQQQQRNSMQSSTSSSIINESKYRSILTSSEHGDGDELAQVPSHDNRNRSDHNNNRLITEDSSYFQPEPPLTMKKILEVFGLIKTPAISVFFIFTVTLSLFPALTVLLESTQKCKTSDRFYNDLFVPFFFILYNLFDLWGRITAGATIPIFNENNIWIGSASRVIFYPLFLLCNITDSQLPVVFKNDAFPMLFMMILAFSNGYIASCCMMMGASCQQLSPKDAPLAGTIMIFSLTVGLLMGSALSFPVVYISQGSL